MRAWSRIGALFGAVIVAIFVLAARPDAAAGLDGRVAAAVEEFLAGDYGAMFDRLAAAARDEDADALRLLTLLHKSGHPALDHFPDTPSWRHYVATTGSEVRLGTGWDARLAALGDPYPAHFLHGGETRDERVAAARFFAERGEWLRAFHIATSTLHLTGGPGADEAFSAIARSGLHDAAGAALRARISAVFQAPEADFTLPERVRSIADFAKAHFDHGEIGVVAGLADMIAGIGGADVLASVSAFTVDELDTVIAVARSDPSRWRRVVPVPPGGGDPARARAAEKRAGAWWRAALADGRWLKHDIEAACARLCPGNPRGCDTALSGGVVPRAWVCLNPHGQLIEDARYRGSVAEGDCLRRLFARQMNVPVRFEGQRIDGGARFAEAQRVGRCSL